MQVSDEERQWLTTHQPNLNVTEDKERVTIAGRFAFCAAFDELSETYVVNPSELDCKRLICLSDEYEVEILMPTDKSTFPKAREVSGKIKAVAEKHGLQLENIHIYEDGELCLVGFFDLSPGITASEFLRIPLLQFLYDQSYFARFGRWPRGQYSHGVVGLLENYCDRIEDRLPDDLAKRCIEFIAQLNQNSAKQQVLQLLRSRKNIQGHMDCLCGSQQQFRDCHERAFRGLWNLHQTMHGK